MRKKSAFIRMYCFYLKGFWEMRLDKTLWLIILVKLSIMFFIPRLFFFLNCLRQFDSDGEKGDHVPNGLVQRAIDP